MSTSAELLTNLFARLDQFVTDGEIAGAALAVSHQGKQVVEWYGGNANDHLPSSLNALWPLASISKLYTAAMILRLIELGDLTLSEPVKTFVPRFTGEGRDEITLRHLLTHTSGMVYESPEMEARLATQTPIQDLVEEALHTPLLGKPGEVFSYSDFNYLLAGEMAVFATRTPFHELVRDLVIKPMGLRHTFMPPNEGDFERIAYVKGGLAEGTDGAMYNSAYGLSLGHPAFGTVATLNDLLRFGLHFAPNGPRIHSEAAIDSMTRDQTGGHALGWHPVFSAGEGKGQRQSWGLGFYFNTPSSIGVFGDLMPTKCFGHAGASGCHLVINPTDDLVIAFVSNTHVHTNPTAWRRRIHAVMNGVMAAITAR